MIIREKKKKEKFKVQVPSRTDSIDKAPKSEKSPKIKGGSLKRAQYDNDPRKFKITYYKIKTLKKIKEENKNPKTNSTKEVSHSYIQSRIPIYIHS